MERESISYGLYGGTGYLFVQICPYLEWTCVNIAESEYSVTYAQHIEEPVHRTQGKITQFYKKK